MSTLLKHVERTMSGLGTPDLIAILAVCLWIFCVYLLPFIINAILARSRGKSVALMLFLTLIFSWIVTLILAFMPKVQKKVRIKNRAIEHFMEIDNANPTNRADPVSRNVE